MKLTRRFFAQMIVGLSLSMPILKSEVYVPKNGAVHEKCGPLSPIRKSWPPMDMDDFVLRMSMHWTGENTWHGERFNIR
jgi:hypothetical protein